MGSGGFTVLGRRLPADGRVRSRARRSRGRPTPAPAGTPTRTCGPASPRTSPWLAGPDTPTLYTSRADASFRMYPGRDRRAARRLVADDGRRHRRHAVVAGPRGGGVGVVARRRAVRRLDRVRAAARPRSGCSAGGPAGPDRVVAALYPVAVLVLVAIVVGAVVNRVRGHTTWRRRTVPAPNARRAAACRRWRRPPCGGGRRRPRSSGNRRSITGRSEPSVNRGSTSATKRRLIATFCSIGRERSTVPTQRDPLGQQQARRSPSPPARRAGRPGRSCPAGARPSGCGRPRRRRRRRARCRHRRPGRGRRAPPAAPPSQSAGVRSSTTSAPSRSHVGHLAGRARDGDAGADAPWRSGSPPCRHRTPPAWTSAQRPLVRPPCTTRASHAVRNTSGTAAASARARPSGTGMARRAGVASCSA